MLFFFKSRKAKKAKEEHERQAKSNASPAPYKHIPTHAGRDALAATPASWSKEEARKRIASAQQIRNTNDSSMTATNSSTGSAESSLSFSILGPQSGLSIDSVMVAQHPRSIIYTQPPLSQRNHGTASTTTRNTHSTPTRPPVPSMPKHRLKYGHVTKSLGKGEGRRKSPLSESSIERDVQNAHGSQGSSMSYPSSESFYSSLGSSTTSSRHPPPMHQNYSLPTFCQPKGKSTTLPSEFADESSDLQKDDGLHQLYEDISVDAEAALECDHVSRPSSRCSTRSGLEFNGPHTM
ncbi:hypothetical protein BU24DRAFT_175032 [Aaosphaeria arxii CBS 175.79]|uniref:Uncharacterized protein n=1 Tax=Aaosphaeria arxii CBS 175.79 TaxID=1450172 RepID=A0A6A5XQW2_9PLEO|nr:uncharacterized protein BU24DRAFT_175032 [Aaosphaeria arxii CBS 175.79]KAF2015289.1 hypothetical protein BU24DRAFT_175032 [Aaosphaeria arxii CBS 175.79]